MRGAQNEAAWDEVSNWNCVLGFRVIYSAADDDRVLVPKHSGLGWTLNFAHTEAWAALGLLIGVPIAIAIAGKRKLK